MANYSLIINSSFKPFSYAEMLAPVQQATTAHQALEDAYGELDAKASIWDKLANESPDSKARKLYQGYADDLRAQADELASNGLNPSSRQAMLNMKRRYAQDIMPIENAYSRRKELIDEQRKILNTDDSIRFDNDFRNVSLDKLLDNPALSYESLSGNTIANRASAMASQYAKVIQGDPRYESILKGQYWRAMQQQGYTPEQIIAEATGDSNAPEPLKLIRKQIHDGLSNNKAYDKDWVDSYISRGMHSAIGTKIYSNVNNIDHMTPYQREQLRLANERLKLAQDAAKARAAAGSGQPKPGATGNLKDEIIITSDGTRNATDEEKKGESTNKGKEITPKAELVNGEVVIRLYGGNRTLGEYDPRSGEFVLNTNIYSYRDKNGKEIKDTDTPYNSYFGTSKFNKKEVKPALERLKPVLDKILANSSASGVPSDKIFERYSITLDPDEGTFYDDPKIHVKDLFKDASKPSILSGEQSFSGSEYDEDGGL